MRRFTVRVDDELYQILEDARGDTNLSEYVRDILTEQLGAAQEQPGAAPSRCEEEVKYLRSKLDEAHKLISQEQVLHLQTQRLLPDQNTNQNIKKPWWQFWK